MGFVPTDTQLRSTAFQPGGAIPARHTGEGDDVSPAVEWSVAPPGARSFAIICHDPDAPLISPGSYGFVHWVLYNIPGTATSLPEGVQAHTGGRNDFGNTGYGGPMPPEGHGVHHYYFWLLALDADLNLPPGLTMWELLERAEPHCIGMNRLIGTYERK